MDRSSAIANLMTQAALAEGSAAAISESFLNAARAAGEVKRFSFEPPKLSELFMEAVTAPQPARRWAVRRRRSTTPFTPRAPARRTPNWSITTI